MWGGLWTSLPILAKHFLIDYLEGWWISLSYQDLQLHLTNILNIKYCNLCIFSSIIIELGTCIFELWLLQQVISVTLVKNEFKSEHATKTNINILNQITSISNYKFLYYFGLPQFKSSEQQMTQEHSPHTNWTQK